MTDERKRINLLPGEVQVSRDADVVLTTLLGSCVAACIYDARAGVFGMNHFLLASRSGRQERPLLSEAGRYGVHAMELLINGLLQQGGERHRLQAKVFGGATLLAGGMEGTFAVGENNARFVTEFLHNEGIPMVASDLGGRRGRQLHFDGRSYSVYVKLVEGRQGRDVAANETRYLRRQLVRQEQGRAGRVTFFDE